MLIDIITFEITVPKLNYTDEFAVEATKENWEKVLEHRFTRNIGKTRVFDFEFPGIEHVPSDFIEEIGDDEMVGSF